MYKVELRSNVKKTLDNIQGKDQSRIISKLIKLELNPRPRGVEKVRGTELWRIREGDFRIIYDIDDKAETITIVRVGHRRDVYRGL